VGWCPDGEFLRPVFPVSRVQHITDLHHKFALRPHHVWKYGIDIQSAMAEIRRGKNNRKKEKPQGKNIMSVSATQGGHNNCDDVNNAHSGQTAANL